MPITKLFLKSIPALLFALLMTVVAVVLGITAFWMFAEFHTLSLSETIFLGATVGGTIYFTVTMPMILRAIKRGDTLFRTTK